MSNHTDTPAKAESIRSIRERIAHLAKSAPQDEDPLAEARAEQRACFVCGYGPHDPTPLHRYWSNADATREAEEYDARTTAPDAAARYVAEYRPY